MAQAYCTGTIHVYVGTWNASPSLAVYLGTCEHYPRVSHRRGWMNVMNDLSGQQLPYDLLYEGQEAFVSMTLTRFNAPVYRALKQITLGISAASAFPGLDLTDDNGTMGTLMMTEGGAKQLWLQNSYGTAGRFPHAAMTDLTGGVHFLNAIFEGPDDEDVGTAPYKVSLNWHCIRAYNRDTNVFTLGDYAVSNLPPPN